VAKATGRWGGLDVLQQHVGIESRQMLVDLSESEWDRVMDVDLKSMFLAPKRLCRRWSAAAAAPSRACRRWRRCVARGHAYARPRAGCPRLRRHRGEQLAPKAIRVNAIAPGRCGRRALDAQRIALRRRSAHLRAEVLAIGSTPSRARWR